MTDISSAELTWVEVSPLDDFWEGEILDLEAEGDEIIVVHRPGAVFKAFQGMCPHQEVLLVDGVYDQDSGRMLCGGHSWEFDLNDGSGINPQGCSLYEFPTKVEDDVVFVGIPQDGVRHYNRCPAN